MAFVWWVPVLISAVCLVGGAGAAARWLPDLAPGPVGGVAFFVVCGLIAGGTDIFGLHCYATVRDLEAGDGFLSSGSLLASDIAETLFECAILFGLAAIVYLVAPRLGGTGETSQPRS